jgi:hypothetical protein
VQVLFDEYDEKAILGLVKEHADLDGDDDY